ncbi:MAG TPA: ATP synthase F0 subunit B [Candidatus Portnoybacteria bacterium]|nr:ATP synthase F0 subunit B [Candidatus Portnoybacteria bacterium]
MSEIIHHLGINWKIFIAQLINFFILLFILRKFVYQPILKILKQRQKKIEKTEKKAQALEEKMKNLNQFEKTKMAEIEKKSNEIIESAKKTAQEKQAEIIQQSKKEASQIIENTKKLTQEKQDKLIDELTPKINQLIVISLKKIIPKKISSDEDKEMIEDVISKSKELIKNNE